MKTSESLFKPCRKNGTSTAARLPVLASLIWWMGTLSMPGLTLLSSNQLVFVNMDHSPMGVCSTMSYGHKGDVCGVGTSTAIYPYWNPSGGGGGGVLIALSGSSGLQILPFVASAASISANCAVFSRRQCPTDPDSVHRRTRGPCRGAVRHALHASVVDARL